MSTKRIITCDGCGREKSEHATEWQQIYGFSKLAAGGHQTDRDFCPKCFASVADALKCVAPVEGPSTDELDRILCDASLELANVKQELAEAKAEITRLGEGLCTTSDELNDAENNIRFLFGILGKKARRKNKQRIAELELAYASQWNFSKMDEIDTAFIRRQIEGLS